MKQLLLVFASLFICYGIATAKYSIEKVDPSPPCCNGSVTAYATGNSGPYTFTWTKNANIIESDQEDDTSSKLIDVCSGTYFVTITNGYGCETTLDITFPLLPIQVCEEEFSMLQLSQPIEVDIKVFLQGAYIKNSLRMRTTLMERGLLPGQTPKSDLVPPTPAGQPYKNTSFGYQGNEGNNWNDEDYKDIGEVVDWILVSIKKATIDTPLQTRAALLLKDGSVVFPNPFDLSTVPDAVMIMIEHRNHLPIISNRVELEDGIINCDFTTSNSFRSPDKAGQKELEADVWTMLAGNASTIMDGFDIYDITGGDKNLWVIKNGEFDQYQPGDMNLDGDVNGQDKALWFDNNGNTGMKLQ